MTAFSRVPRRSLLRWLVAVLLVALVAACGAAPASLPVSTPSASPSPAVVTDFQGRSVQLPRSVERIVSIGASNTEFLFALGAGDRVVGVDDFSDEPLAALKKEKVGGVKVNLEKITSLRPDLVITVKFSDGTVERLAAGGAAVLVVDPQGLGDVARSAVLIGQAVGADGKKLADDIARRLQSVKERAAAVSARPRVFHEVDATDPAKPFTVGPGSFVHDLIELAGGVNVAARAPSPYPQLSAEELVRADPEVIVLADADYGVTPEQVASRPGWSGIAAVRTKRVYGMSANLVSRPGPRVAEAAEAYAKLLHPTVFR